MNISYLLRKYKLQSRVALLVMLCVTFVYMIFSRVDSIRTNYELIGIGNKKLADKKSLYASINLVDAKQISSIKELVDKAVSKRVPYIEVLNSLTTTTAVNGLRLSAVKVKSTKASDADKTGQTFPFEIETVVNGNTASVWQFVDTILKMTPIVLVQGVSVSGKDDLQARLTLKYYYTLENKPGDSLKLLDDKDMKILTKLSAYQSLVTVDDNSSVAVFGDVNRDLFGFEEVKTLTPPLNQNPQLQN